MGLWVAFSVVNERQFREKSYILLFWISALIKHIASQSERISAELASNRADPSTLKPGNSELEFRAGRAQWAPQVRLPDKRTNKISMTSSDQAFCKHPLETDPGKWRSSVPDSASSP